MNKDFDFYAKSNPYRVPEGFFERNRAQLLMTASVYSRRARNRFIAAAASIAVVVGVAVTGWLSMNNKSLSVDEKIDLMIADAPDTQLSTAVAMADAEYLFDTEYFSED